MIYILIKIMKNTIIKTIVGFLTGVAITKISVTFNNSPIVTIEDNITNLKSKIIAYLFRYSWIKVDNYVVKNLQ